MAVFKDILTIKNGKNQKAVENPQGRYPIYGSGGIMGYADSYICEPETVIIGRKGNINNPIFCEDYFWNIDTAFGLVADKRSLLPKYLFYFCKNFDFQSLNTTVTIPSLTKTNLLNIHINLPSLSEQKRIVAILDKVTELIELRKQQMEKLDLLVKSNFTEIFGYTKTNSKQWKLIPLEAISDIGSSKRVFVEELQQTGIPFYRGTEIGVMGEGKKIKPELFVSKKHYEALCKSTSKPSLGDLLMPSICPDGRIWLVDTDDPFYFKDGRVLWVHNIKENINKIYLRYALKEKFLCDYNEIASGTTFCELKIFSLKKVKIMSPPLHLQEQFADLVQQVDKIKSTLQQSLEKLELNYKALMQTYFG